MEKDQETVMPPPAPEPPPLAGTGALVPPASPAQTELAALVAQAEAGTLPPYQRTPEEQAVVDRLRARQAARPEMPLWFLQQAEDGKVITGPVHLDPELGRALTMEALGITSPKLLDTLVSSLVQLSRSGGKPSEARLQQLMARVQAVAPKDEAEAMLAVQMAATGDATAAMARRLNDAGSLPEQESSVRALNSLARTHAMQLEALKRHRNGGQQNVVVRHVTVNEGGQAIVGRVGGGEQLRLE